MAKVKTLNDIGRLGEAKEKAAKFFPKMSEMGIAKARVKNFLF